MFVLVSLMPGVSFACFAFLFLLGLYQLNLYRITKYRRSRSLFLFCFFASFFALEPFIAHSRVFDPRLAHFYVMFSTVCFCLSSIFYIHSIRYFIAVPSWLVRLVVYSSVGLALLAFLSIPSFLLFSESFFFDPQNLLDTTNEFMDSYTNRIGAPLPTGLIILSVASWVNSCAALLLLRLVLKSSQDIYFIIGLCFTVLASFLENILLPFTLSVFFPLIFLSNLFEAFRMNALSHKERIQELVKKEQFVEATPSGDLDKYQNSNLNEQRIAELADKVTQVLEKNKIFLKPNLNSEQLAKEIGIPSYQLSQVVNIGLKTTFYDLLSRYRIEEVKARLAMDKFSDETILNIAYDCGFNSKSSFNTAFKRVTGLTPSAYRKNVVASENQQSNENEI